MRTLKCMNIRLAAAMSSYAVLGVIGTFVLDGKMRLALWIFLAGLAVRTLIAWKRFQ